MTSSRENNGPNTPADEPCLLYSNKKAERLQRVCIYSIFFCTIIPQGDAQAHLYVINQVASFQALQFLL